MLFSLLPDFGPPLLCLHTRNSGLLHSLLYLFGFRRCVCEWVSECASECVWVSERAIVCVYLAVFRIRVSLLCYCVWRWWVGQPSADHHPAIFNHHSSLALFMFSSTLLPLQVSEPSRGLSARLASLPRSRTRSHLAHLFCLATPRPSCHTLPSRPLLLFLSDDSTVDSKHC